MDKRRKGGEAIQRLNRSWFTCFPFIAYSQYCQGIFCVACVFFPCQPQNPDAKRADTLTVKPLTDWKYGKEMLSKHAGIQDHLCSEAKLSEFLRAYRTPSRHSNHMLTTEL